MTSPTPASPDKSEFLLVPRRRPGLRAHLLAALMVVAGMEFGWLIWVEAGTGALIWPPAGIALGLAMVYGYRILPVPALTIVLWGGLATEAAFHEWLLVALGLILGAGAGAAGLRWLRRSGRARGPVQELLGFWFFGPLLAGLIGAFLGAMALQIQFPEFAEYRFMDVWGAYWVAEAFGILLFAPLLAQLSAALSDGRFREALNPGPWQLAWLGGVIALVLLQLALERVDAAGFAAMLVYLYFPLLAVAASLGRPLFQALSMFVVGCGFLLVGLFGLLGLEPPADNTDLIETIMLVIAFTIMTQAVSGSAESIRGHLARAREAARRDYLTGLLNERGLAEAVRAHKEMGTLAMLDLPGVRRVMDLAGLESANHLELQIADQLRARVPLRTQVARFGRGLFALLVPMPAEASRSELEGLYRGLDETPVNAGALSLAHRPSLGAVSLNADGNDADRSLSLVSIALHRAEEESGQRLRVDASGAALLEEELADERMADAIGDALGRADGFALYLQRILPLSEQADRRPRYEVLLRMPDGEGGVLSPGRFMPVAARHHRMPEIDRWVVEHAFAAAARYPGVQFTINLSGQSLTDLHLADWIEERRRHHGVDSAQIWFEVTESETIEHHGGAEDLLSRLRASGFRVALDDFGTGLASFEYLRNFSVDALKIDGAFVREARERGEDRAIVAAIQALAGELGLWTVAEFVEDEWLLEWLRSAGVDYGQGYGIARPVPLEAALRDGDG